MAQEPNIPKLKTSEACLIQVDPLIQLVDLICSAENQLACSRMPESSVSRINAIKTIEDIRTSGFISSDLLDEVERKLKDAGEYGITKQTTNGLIALRRAKWRAFWALLDAAVDCECREAKAAYEQLSSAAVQTVLGSETKGDGGQRPRRWTEIPGKAEETSTEFKPGDRVIIFEDPVTEKKPEGEARLIQPLFADPELQYWEVEFLSDGSRVSRWIKPKEAR